MSTSSNRSELLELGYIARAHGLRGEVRVTLYNKASDALEQVEHVWLRPRESAETRRHQLLGVRRANQAYLIHIAGVDDKAQADALRGCAVSVARAELPPLEPGEYYLTDLMNAEVFEPNGLLGRVVDLGVHPTVDTIVIETPDGRRLEQPLLEPWLEKVDAEAGRIELSSLEGLLE